MTLAFDSRLPLSDTGFRTTQWPSLAANADARTEKVWKVALDTGANVLALTVLEAAASSPRLTGKRDELNAMIKDHQEDRLYVRSSPNLQSCPA